MKGLLSSLGTLIRAAFSGGGPSKTIIDAAALMEEMAKNPALVVLDVRSNAERGGGFIEGSVHIPIQELPGRIGELDRGKRIIVHCLAGHRSAIAYETLRRSGFADIADYAGGWRDWQVKGLPTVKETHRK
jgi:hydroxyacylglutathione hydrolase